MGVAIFGVEVGSRHRGLHAGHRTDLRHHHHDLCGHSAAVAGEGADYFSEEDTDSAVDIQFGSNWID